MAPINRNSISLYEDAKATFISLLQQTAQVGAGLIILLLLTGGNPPGFMMGLSFFLGVGFVAWSEKNRLEKLTTDNFSSIKEVITSPTELNLDELFPETLSDNKRAILKTKINLILYSTKHLEIQTLIQKVLSIETDNFSELAQIVNLDIKEDFIEGNLERANLKGIDLRDANLKGANLKGIYLGIAYLRSINLEGANLEGAYLGQADLESANLKNANLENAYLKNTNLNNAKVKNAKFGYNQGISESMRQELIARGAIFIDSLNDYGQTPTSTK